MFTLLRQISLPELRRHRLRSVLTITGIILGVAIFTAIRSANISLRASIRDTIDQLAGKAVLQVTAGQAGLPETVLEEIRSVTGIRAAAPIIEAVVRTTDSRQGNILMIGVDMTGDQSMRDYSMADGEDVISDPLVFLAQPDSILVSEQFAARNDLRTESRIDLVTALGTRTFTVRGIMAPRGVAKAFGGNLGVMDIYSAQFIFGRGRTFDRVDVSLDEGLKIDEAIARLRDTLGSGYKIEPPLRRGKQVESLLEAYSRALFFSSAIALTIGIFLIFNSLSISVAQRRTQIGVLRALGVPRSGIRNMFLAESFVLGSLGSIIGVGAGLLTGRTMMSFMATIVAEIYGVRVALGPLRADTLWTAASFVLGVAASLAGGYLPARSAARVDPALALQKGKYQTMFLGENRTRRRVGLLLLLACAALGISPISSGLQFQSFLFVLLFLGLVLIVPTFSHLLAGLLRWPMSLLFGIEGRLASDSLVQAPRRTSATVSALMFSLAFVLVMATFSASIKASFTVWIDATINPDLFVSASENITVRNFQFPASVGEELKKVGGVRQVDAVRMFNIEYGDSSPLLVSIEMDQFLGRSTPLMEDGKIADLLPGMLNRLGVLISNNFAYIHKLRKGNRIFLDTPSGRQEFEVVGVSVDYSSDNGSLMIDRAVYKRLWKDDRVDVFDLMLEEGYDPEQVRSEIQHRFAGSRNVLVLTNQDMRAEITRLTDQFLTLQYVQLLVAVVVAVLGILNSLMVSITERRREIGILRGLGGEMRQIRKAVLLEAACVGLVAVILGIAGGTVMGYYSVGNFSAAFNGWILPYRFPAEMALGLVPGVILISLLAAWYPSSLALKTPIVEALSYE